jgi:hypothetical protein
MLNTLILCAAILFATAGAAHADNSACWGDESRIDIACVQITEQLLLDFRGQTFEFVRKAMQAEGRGKPTKFLHFLSMYNNGRGGGSGSVNLTFADGAVTIVNAAVDTGTTIGRSNFVWNAYEAPQLGGEIDLSTRDFARAPYCSDFAGRSPTCVTQGLAEALTLYQMSFGSNRDELLQLLELSCGLAADDPYKECVRLRRRLR